MLLTRAAHHLLMMTAAEAPREPMMSVANVRQHISGAGLETKLDRSIGGIHGATRMIDWRVEKDEGQEDGWMHARISSKNGPLEWRVENDLISVKGMPLSSIFAYEERVSAGSFPATDIVALPYLQERTIIDVTRPDEGGALFILSGSYRDNPIAEFPKTMGEWRNAGKAYAKQLQDDFKAS